MAGVNLTHAWPALVVVLDIIGVFVIAGIIIVRRQRAERQRSAPPPEPINES